MSFQPRPKDELLKLPDEKIIEYSVAARDAGDLAAFAEGVRTFVWARMPMIEAKIARKVGPPEDRDDVVQRVLASALQSAPRVRGSHAGEFVNWLKRIIQFRIADYHKARRRQLDHERPSDVSLDGDDPGFLIEIVDTADQYGELEAIDLLVRELETYSPAHRRVIELRMDGYPSREVAEILSEDGEMSPGNVDKIFSRFRKRIKPRLEESSG